MTKPQLPATYQHALRSQPGPQCVAMLVNGLASIVIKLDRHTIADLRGPVPIAFRPELGLFQAGAVVRLAVAFHDRPGSPLEMDTFLNPAAPEGLAILRCLSTQDILDFHLFDMGMEYQLSKRIPLRQVSRSEVASMIDDAHMHNAHLDEIDFPTAKAAMMKERPL